MQDNLQGGAPSGDLQENANQQQSQQSSIPDDVKTLMDISLYGQLPADRQQALQQQLNGEAQEGAEGGAAASGAAGQPAAGAEQQQAGAVAFDEVKYVKDTFGFENVEEAKTAFAAWQAAGKPQQASAPTFANEQSKKIYEAIVAGNLKPVKEFLDVQFATENLDTLSPEQQVKLHLKHQYPTLTSQMVDRHYAKTYGLKEESEYEDPIDFQIAQQMVQQRIINDAAAAKNFFNEYKTKIELPQIQSIQPTVDEAYDAWKASNAQAEQEYSTVTVPVINAIKEGDLAAKFVINDPNAQMNFEISQVVTPQHLATAKQHALNYGEYMQKQFYTPDGKLNGTRIVQAILRDMLFDEYVQTTARQAVNAERKRNIAKEIPASNQFNRQEFNAGQEGQETEMQRNMRLSRV